MVGFVGKKHSTGKLVGVRGAREVVTLRVSLVLVGGGDHFRGHDRGVAAAHEGCSRHRLLGDGL